MTVPQPSLFDPTPPPDFGGATYEPDHDRGRLARQLGRVKALMLDGQWRTLREIAAATGDPEASASARLRDMRKVRFGAYTLERRRRDEAVRGIFEYRVV
jgi:hypothetical protein